jgi:hypothetical protein
LPTGYQQKILPYGLNYACRSRLGERLLLQAKVSGCLTRYRNTLPIAHFEQGPEVPARSSIVFQTRAWAPESTSDNADEVNEARARIIRQLQKAFPKQFEGGFVPNTYARERYRDLISTYPHEPGQYVTFSKRHLIGISSRGLHESIPFKVPEYMAASIAIVSEPLRNDLPSPFLDHSGYLEFLTADECVSQCDRILTNRKLADDLRQASWRYYMTEVRPAQHTANLLERARRTASAENRAGSAA